MSMMVTEVYDALKEAGTSEDKARRAAETLANTDSRFNRIDIELAVLKWMVGTVLAGVVTSLLKQFGVIS